ncbi:Transmembrane protein 104 [Nesidiocoris tenuis]|uniref:Transmembrane protein 104 n=1 Tax=Nesidiocoris tenuis TaxID=355587 RepID=A0ABN7AKY3_9HEMI|nr:Transmembrane protein 104 [Nesidiocoris tenuis]
MEDQYSTYTALLYIFNLIVGTGALTLPKAFFDAGWVLGIKMTVVMAMMSYITATFVIEAISRCHSIIQWERVERMKRLSREIVTAMESEEDEADDDPDSAESSLMLPSEYIENFPSQPQRMYTLDVRVELSVMASTVFNRFGQILFFVCLCVYLYGDLTIYSAAVAKTLVDTFCDNPSADANVTTTSICWEGYNFTKDTLYKIYLGCFLLLFGPFVFFNVQKTKIIQMVTSFYRFTTFGVMIGLAIWRLSSPSFDHGSPVMTEWSATPALFGSLVYSFMCHHSLPGLIAPIKDKTNLYGSLAANYVIILLLYLTLGLTAVFAFPYIEDLYTLNFDPDNAMTKPLARIGYVLALFPVFTLTTSFPIISVTLRGNLQAMFMRFPWRPLHSICLPILTVVPPVIIAMFTPKIEILVSITGSFAGMTIQYIIPAMLVLCARAQTPPNLLNYPNPYSSPFQSMVWPIVILLWAAICYTLVLYNLFTKKAIVDLF